MIIERMRHSSNGAVNPNAFGAIREVEIQASDEYLAYLQEVGELTGETYTARIAPSTELDPDLQPYVSEDGSNCYVSERKTDDDTRTFVFDLNAKKGVQRQIYKDEDPEYYEVDESYGRYLGFDLLDEIFQPGSHPELSELVATRGADLINPNETSARIMTAEEHRKAAASAVLSRLALSHLDHVLTLYASVAYPGQEKPTMSPEELKRYYDGLREGSSVGLRTGTRYLDCAKHELRADVRDDRLKTWMYLNYDIPFGPVKLHLDGDIDMAVEFGEQASSYFEQEGIAVS